MRQLKEKFLKPVWFGVKWARKLNKRVWCFDINASGNIDTIKNGAIKFSNLEEFISSYNNEIKQ